MANNVVNNNGYKKRGVLMKANLPVPIGAIWIRGWNLRQRIKKMFEDYNLTIKDDELDEVLKSNHTLAVKVNTNVEKFIALQNKKKDSAYCKCKSFGSNRRVCPKCQQPDYFIHVYQSHTGAAPMDHFRASSSIGQEGEEIQPTLGTNDLLGGGRGDVSPASGSEDCSTYTQTSS